MKSRMKNRRRHWYYETKPLNGRYLHDASMQWTKVSAYPQQLDAALRSMALGMKVYGHLYHGRIRHRNTGEIIPGDIFI